MGTWVNGLLYLKTLIMMMMMMKLSISSIHTLCIYIFTSISDPDSYHFVKFVITLSYLGIKGKWNTGTTIQKTVDSYKDRQPDSSVWVQFTKIL